MGKRLIGYLINLTVKAMNRNRSLPDLQKKYSAYQRKIMVLDVYDVGYTTAFQLGDGEVYQVRMPRNPSVNVKCSLNTMLDLAKGVDRNGKPFTPNMAWAYGLLMVEGPGGQGWLSDATLFTKIWSIISPELKAQVNRIVPT